MPAATDQLFNSASAWFDLSAVAAAAVAAVTIGVAVLLQGALHMQEQLGWPVIPVTIRGAYELFPLKWNVNECGRVRAAKGSGFTSLYPLLMCPMIHLDTRFFWKFCP